MARIKKYADNLTQNLTYFQTYLVDTNPNSTYFENDCEGVSLENLLTIMDSARARWIYFCLNGFVKLFLHPSVADFTEK